MLTPEARVQQLSEQEAALLYTDGPNANGNVTLVHIYDQSTAPGGKVRFKAVLDHIEGRLARLPILRRKLLRVPLELDYPYWVEDEDFSLEYHVRHIALPKPGDWRQFCIQAARIHARPLDLARPPWELYVVEGLDGLADLPPGSFAVLAKLHHAALDFEKGCEFTRLLHDEEAVARPVPPPEPWFPLSPPDELTLVGRAMARAAAEPWRLLEPWWRLASSLIPWSLDRLGHPERELPVAHPTRFNAVVSPHRVFETRRFSLADVDAIAGLAPEARREDVALALIGDALRRYLGEQAEIPPEDLTALTVAEPTEETETLAWTRCPLSTDISDPAARLAAIRDRTTAPETRLLGNVVGNWQSVAAHAPAAAVVFTSRLMAMAASRIGPRAPVAHCVVTPVPGPERPLYLSGARMTYFSAILPVADGMGLVFAVTAYDGKLVISPTGCRDQLPDPEVLARCLREAFEEYLSAARQGVRISHR